MPTEFPHGYALLIGVDANQVDRWALPAVAKDIAAVAAVLAHPDRCGAYPDGATPEGLHDLSGIVWEWTGSVYQSYPYRADDGRNNPEAEGPRVVRGGSWFFFQRSARCAVRFWFVPDYFLDLIGFRVVVSLSF